MRGILKKPVKILSRHARRSIRFILTVVVPFDLPSPFKHAILRYGESASTDHPESTGAYQTTEGPYYAS